MNADRVSRRLARQAVWEIPPAAAGTVLVTLLVVVTALVVLIARATRRRVSLARDPPPPSHMFELNTLSSAELCDCVDDDASAQAACTCTDNTDTIRAGSVKQRRNPETRTARRLRHDQEMHVASLRSSVAVPLCCTSGVRCTST
jgi:hypothetical protein